MKSIIPSDNIQQMIYIIRGQKVMLDEDLAQLYEVPTKVLIQAIKRNRARFPQDFMFQLNNEEARQMRSQFVTASKRNIRFKPYAFTEHGVTMLSSVLRSQKAIQINILIVRAFARLREMVNMNRALAKRLAAIERRLTGHEVDISKIYKIISEWPGTKEITGFKAIEIPKQPE